MRTTKGLYIHIPFCISKCTYCDFYSVSKDTETMEKYVNALVEEIRFASNKNENLIIDTIYIGGGTPSVLPPFLFEKIVCALRDNFVLEVKEFSMEANPATNVLFETYKNLGVNRISLGVQTLNDRLLKLIGRAHDAKTALQTIENARKHFDNVSCDLMIGLPTQTMQDVENSAKIIAKEVEHVSTYMLKLSSGVKMQKQIDSGVFELPDDDTFVDFYDKAYEVFESCGLKRYEISNFARDGFECKHNLKYWERKEYLGLGAAAHGFLGNVRYFNPSSVESYIAGNNYGNGKEIREIIDEETALFEKIMLGLRLPNGIDLAEINREFGIDFEKKFTSQLRNLKGILIKEGNKLFIKGDKLLLESAVAREFLD